MPFHRSDMGLSLLLTPTERHHVLQGVQGFGIATLPIEWLSRYGETCETGRAELFAKDFGIAAESVIEGAAADTAGIVVGHRSCFGWCSAAFRLASSRLLEDDSPNVAPWAGQRNGRA
jgi:hypothetical protein